MEENLKQGIKEKREINPGVRIERFFKLVKI